MMQALDPNTLAEIQKEFDNLLREAGVNPDEVYMKDLDEDLQRGLDDLSDEIREMYSVQRVSFEKCHPDAVIPSYAYPSDSGFDFYSVDKIVLPPFGRAAVPTGLKVEFPENFEIQVRPKSGLALNLGLTVLNTPGTVDHGYTGEIKVIVFNTNNNSVIIDKGMKIAQGVLSPVFCGKLVRIQEVSKIGEKDRGNNGFGSTGINL